MEEAHTPNPSEPDPDNKAKPADPSGPPYPPEAAEKRPKLKLKQILKPLSPHLTAPRPERDPRLEKKEVPKPSPQAVPVELEPEPVPEPSSGIPVEEESEAPPQPVQPLPPEEQETATEAEEEAGAEEEEAADKQAGPESGGRPAPKWSRRLLLWLGAPVVLLAGIAWLLVYIFSPGEPELAAVSQEQLVAALERSKAKAEGTASTADLSPVDLTLAIEGQTVDSYLEKLRRQEIIPSTQPRGIFVNSVFVPEGGILNPRLGLFLVQVEVSAYGSLIDLQDASHQSYRIALEE
jgi:hypothetical protein